MEPQIIESTFAQCRVNCIASGQMEGEMKFYFFSKHVKQTKLILKKLIIFLFLWQVGTQKFIFLECQINKNNNMLNLNVKSEDDELAAFYSKYIESILINNGFI